MDSSEPCAGKNSITAIGLIIVLVLICYCNSFQGSWHLDDLPNIVHNSELHLESISLASLKRVFTAAPNDPAKERIYRPLACLSLALNWYAGRDDPFGYHLVNLSFHLITAVFLFMAIRLLLTTPALATCFSKREGPSIALLAAVLWAINPIQIQAVTYIVQRMAAMAAMFTVIGLYAYLRARMAWGKNRGLWSIILFLSFGCALLSKENAILFPFSIGLVEAIFFGSSAHFERLKASVPLKGILITAGGVVILVCAILHLIGNPIDMGGYAQRPFSLWQRLISQPRVILFYLSLLIYPAPWRLSIEHDIFASTSLLSPWTTLPSILCILALAGFGLWAAKKLPVIGFAILFFLLNHAVESTVLPLELVFEHRNYLPSLFFFLPFAFYAIKLANRCQRDFHHLYLGMIVCLVAIIAATGYACYLRNAAWQTEYSLWFDALKKAPGSARPLMNLGVAIGWGDSPLPNRDDIALSLFRKALTLPSPRKRLPAKIYGNIGLLQMRKGAHSQAIGAYQKALEIAPKERKIRFDLIRALITIGNWRGAEEHLEILLSDGFATPSDLSYKGFVRLWQGDPEKALTIFRKVLQSGYQDPFVFHAMGVSMTQLNHIERGKWFLERALETAKAQSRGKMAIYFSLMENRHKALSPIGAKNVSYRLLGEFNLAKIVDTLRRLPGGHTYPPIDIETVSSVLSTNLLDVARSAKGR